MGCTHHTLYFIYLPIKLASLKTLLKNILILLYMGFMYYVILNTL